MRESYMWQYLVEEFGDRCIKCSCLDSQRNPLQLDHIIPRSKGGRTTLANLQILCRACNLAKFTAEADYRPIPWSRLFYLRRNIEELTEAERFEREVSALTAAYGQHDTWVRERTVKQLPLASEEDGKRA